MTPGSVRFEKDESGHSVWVAHDDNGCPLGRFSDEDQAKRAAQIATASRRRGSVLGPPAVRHEPDRWSNGNDWVAYNDTGEAVGRFFDKDEASRAAKAANLALYRDREEIAADAALLGAKPTEVDLAAVAQLSPGLHLDINQPPNRRSRRIAYRSIAQIPYVLASFAVMLVTVPTTVIAWVMIVSTGRYPPSLFAWNRGAVRFLVRLWGYTLLMTDVRPPLSGKMIPRYPIRVEVAQRDHYSPGLALLRLPLLLPLAAANLAGILLGIVVCLISLPVIRATGRQAKALQKLATISLRIYAESLCFALLMTQDWWPLHRATRS
jgi:hypothetical protein